MIRDQVDTLILGCTHYPLVAPYIAERLGDKVNLIDAGKEEAKAAKAMLTETGLLASPEQTGDLHIYISSSGEHFLPTAERFLGIPLGGMITSISPEELTNP
jgi:glutamate racemase